MENWFGTNQWIKREKNKIEAKWEKGLWLGTAREANETLIGTKDGVARCYAIKRMTEEDRWSSAEIAAMQGTPQQPSPNKVGLHIPTRLPTEVAPDGGPDGAAVEGDDGQEIPPAT